MYSLAAIMAIYVFVPNLSMWEDKDEIHMTLYMWSYTSMLSPIYCWALYWLSNPKDVLGKALKFKIVWVLGAIGPGLYLFFVPAYDFSRRSLSNEDMQVV